MPPSGEQSAVTGTEQKRKEEENAFFIIKGGNLKVILHTGNTRKNLPKTYFSLLKNRNLNTFPLLLPAEKNGRVQIKLLRKKTTKSPVLIQLSSTQKVFKPSAKHQRAHKQTKEKIWQQNVICKQTKEKIPRVV